LASKNEEFTTEDTEDTEYGLLLYEILDALATSFGFIVWENDNLTKQAKRRGNIIMKIYIILKQNNPPRSLRALR
jgi:hypothetical protein